MIDEKNTSSMTDSEGNFKIKVKQNANMIGIISFANGMIEEAIYGTRGYGGAVVVTTKKENK